MTATKSKLTADDRRELAEYLIITSRYLRQLAGSDALGQRMSRSAADRLRAYADYADTLRVKLQGRIS